MVKIPSASIDLCIMSSKISIDYSLIVPIVKQMMNWGKTYLRAEHPACNIYIPENLLAEVA
jgi:hypothetical protein